ncbi:MAG: hypothetical protein IPJ77_02990 [Planctomycetes bacterium]|nr:hypothetical protein [Planctomycetota bacterium]
MPRRRTPTAPAVVGVLDHAGWAILVTARGDGTVLDRRRIELVDAGLPEMPHHHEGQRLPLEEAVALVARVRASAERNAKARLAELAVAVPTEITGIALRALQPLPPTVAERITDYRAMCVADWVMYREALAAAAVERGWTVSWFEPKHAVAEAAAALEQDDVDAVLDAPGATLGPPWRKDHKVALAAAIAAARGRS